MGYRTCGKWVIKGPADVVRTAWAAARLEVEPFKPDERVAADPAVFNNFKVYYITLEAGEVGYIRFEFDDWKWYSSYPDVQFYERVWSYLSEVEGLTGKRVHIGEDNAIDEAAFGDDCIELYANCIFTDDEYQPPDKE